MRRWIFLAPLLMSAAAGAAAPAAWTKQDQASLMEAKVALEKFKDCAAAATALEKSREHAVKRAEWFELKSRIDECREDVVAARDAAEEAERLGAKGLDERLVELRYRVQKAEKEAARVAEAAAEAARQLEIAKQKEAEAAKKPEVTAPTLWVQTPGGKLWRTEVTVAQFEACVKQGKCTAPHIGVNCNWGVAGRGEHPVNCVDWASARAFCAASGARLPRAEEWEAAATNGGTTRYPWGNEEPDSHRAQYSAESTAPVGTHPTGATKAGVQDMVGNVAEWMEGDNAGGKEVRGSSWGSFSQGLVTVSHNRFAPVHSDVNFGFRCAQ